MFLNADPQFPLDAKDVDGFTGSLYFIELNGIETDLKIVEFAKPFIL